MDDVQRGIRMFTRTKKSGAAAETYIENIFRSKRHGKTLTMQALRPGRLTVDTGHSWSEIARLL